MRVAELRQQETTESRIDVHVRVVPDQAIEMRIVVARYQLVLERFSPPAPAPWPLTPRAVDAQ